MQTNLPSSYSKSVKVILSESKSTTHLKKVIHWDVININFVDKVKYWSLSVNLLGRGLYQIPDPLFQKPGSSHDKALDAHMLQKLN